MLLLMRQTQEVYVLKDPLRLGSTVEQRLDLRVSILFVSSGAICQKTKDAYEVFVGLRKT